MASKLGPAWPSCMAANKTEKNTWRKQIYLLHKNTMQIAVLYFASAILENLFLSEENKNNFIEF